MRVSRPVVWYRQALRPPTSPAHRRRHVTDIKKPLGWRLSATQKQAAKPGTLFLMYKTSISTPCNLCQSTCCHNSQSCTPAILKFPFSAQWHGCSFRLHATAGSTRLRCQSISRRDASGRKRSGNSDLHFSVASSIAIILFLLPGSPSIDATISHMAAKRGSKPEIKNALSSIPAPHVLFSS